MRALIGLDSLYEPSDNWRKALLVVEPIGKKMHPDTRQMGRERHDFCARGNRPAPSRLARATFSPIELPLDPQPVEMADAHRNRGLSLGDLCEQHPARTRRVLVEPLPQQGRFTFAKLSPSITG